MRHIYQALIVCALCFSVSPAQAVEVEKVVSAKGITAWLVRDSANPITSIRFSFRGGSSLDPAGKQGLATFAASVMDEGAGDLDSQAFQKELEDLSVSLRFDTGLDGFNGRLRTLNKHRDRAAELMRLALSSPRFDKEPTERVRAQLISGLRQSEQDPNTLASRAMFKTMFPAHPYAQPSGGSIEGISKIDAADLKMFVAARLARDNLTVGVVGDISKAELGQLLDRIFGGLPAKATAGTVTKTMPTTKAGVRIVDLAVPPSSIQWAQPGLLRSDPDFYAAYVLNYVLGGGGFVSRLYSEVREKRGLAYSVYSYLMPLDRAGAWVGGAATANARVSETLETVKAVWARMAAEGPTADELKNAKTYLTGSFPLRFTSSDRIAGMLVGMQEDKLGIDYIDRRNSYIEKVTLADVRRVAKNVLDPAKLSFVVAGRPEGVKPTN